MYPPDALAHVSELLRGVIETIDEHCRARAGEPGLNMLLNAMHTSEIAHSLVEHVYIKHLIREGDMEYDHKLLGAADYLSALAKALMNDIEMAKNRLH